MNEALAQEVLRQNAEARLLRAELAKALRELKSSNRLRDYAQGKLKAARKRILALNREIKNT